MNFNYKRIKKICKGLSLLSGMLILSASLMAQDNTWPKTINAQDGSLIKIFEPVPESFAGNILKSRSAISLLMPDSTEPVFGTFWAVETVQTDRDNRTINIESVKVPNLKFSSDVPTSTIDYLKTTLENNIPELEPSVPLDAVVSALEIHTEEKKLSKNLDNNPPKIIYTTEPSILVLIDGNPKLQINNDWGLEAVVNTPFTIVRNNDGTFYLYGGKHWYKAFSATGPYSAVTNIPNNLYKIQTSVDNVSNTDPGFSNDASTAQSSNALSNIIVSTTPTELIQSNGQPAFTPIDGTSLSYVSNSQNDIFQNQGDQQYYVLISGRWYKSPDLNGPWVYTPANELPSDFSKIPEGSPKDNVLASVAGTQEAKEAVMDAQIPQTAKVDRNNAHTNVTYDGDPKFENIQGTNMQYATNTQNSVVYAHGKYYCVDNGVWFESYSPNGPWVVCITRPDEIDLIPPSYPVYNMKYVYIYDADPNWVYMGYTPGYLNAYIYGATVVYGTGYYYRPWWGRHYYPRPCTWGFSVDYNPWYGWNIGHSYGFGWLNIGFGISDRSGYWGGGWWGPAIYRPPFRATPYRTNGYYGFRQGVGGRNNFYGRTNSIGNNRFAGNVRVNNIYNFRRDAITVNNNQRFYNNNAPRTNYNSVNGGRVNNNPSMGRGVQGVTNNQSYNGGRGIPVQRNNTAPTQVLTDRQGNVYQRGGNGNSQQWQQRQQNQWKPAANEANQNMNRQQQMQSRGQQRTQSFQMSRQQQNNGGGGARTSGNSGGGGGRSNGGNRGR